MFVSNSMVVVMKHNIKALRQKECTRSNIYNNKWCHKSSMLYLSSREY